MKSLSPGTFDHQAIALRLLLAALLGLCVAGILTWFMFALIQLGEKEIDERKRVQILDFVRLKREENSVQNERRAERPKTAKAPPAPPTPAMGEADSNIAAIAVSDIPVQVDMNIDMNIGSGISEGEYLPIVKVAPVYPASAANRGIEGQCLVEYTVSTTGATKDIRVVEDQCSYSGFRKPSVAAAARFKYKPRMINGQPVEVQRVRNLFIFTLQDANEND